MSHVSLYSRVTVDSNNVYIFQKARRKGFEVFFNHKQMTDVWEDRCVHLYLNTP
jgi:hypothetical protein